MFTKKLFQKAATQQLLQQRDRRHHQHQDDPNRELQEEEIQPPADPQGDVMEMEFRPRFTVHYGIPITARILTFDPIQSLVAVGTLDGRIKVIGGNNIEAPLVSPKEMSMKHLEFLKREGTDVGIILFFQTGDIELRSLPNLQVMGESSSVSILRWNFKANMENSENGQITRVNGSEFVALSFLAKENDFRISLSLPSLHDEVLEAASSTHINLSVDQKKQNVGRGIFVGVFKGLILGDEDDDIHVVEEDNH